MRRRIIRVAVAFVVLALATGLVLVSRPATGGQIYTVAQVNAGLARNPSAWLGRVVQIRGRAAIFINHGAVTCCSAFLDDTIDPAQRIRLVWRGVSPMLAVLLRIPLVGVFVAPRVGGIGVYRVLIQQAERVVPAPGLPNYYPYTNRTVVLNENRAELVYDLS